MPNVSNCITALSQLLTATSHKQIRIECCDTRTLGLKLGELETYAVRVVWDAWVKVEDETGVEVAGFRLRVDLGLGGRQVYAWSAYIHII